MTIERLYPQNLLNTSELHYSQVAVTTGRKTIYVAGQTALNNKMEVVGDTLEEQMTQVFTNLTLALTDAGATLNDIARLDIYIVDYNANMIPVYTSVMAKFFDVKHLPTNTLLGVQALALPDLLVEVTATAVID